MHRRSFLKGAALAGAALRIHAAPLAPLLYLSREEAARLKPHARLAREAELAMTRGPWSVTAHRPGALSQAGPHDFFSEGPYWWPDPAKPGGPYIRRDGEVNPERFTANDDDLSAMAETVLQLGLAAYFLKDQAAAGRAWKIIDVWFLQPGTYMTPNLEYGQAIRGVTTGRGIGIIDSRPLIWCVQGAALLESCFPDPAKAAGLKQWFAQYVQWLTTSRKGTDERDNGNNHATWWAAQVAAYSVYCGDEKSEQLAYDHYRNVLVPTQLKPDGSAPKEEARTKSLSYTCMNLDGFALLCRLAEKRGHDLWSFQTKDGAGVLTSFAYAARFLRDPSAWKKRQITPAGRIRPYFPALAGMGAKRPEWIELQKRLLYPGNAWGQLTAMMVDAWQPPA
jgi:hypothetical protein